ncbi:hypothetical protein AOA80_10920 [Methanomassiliicoccales archaeon RumEn M1]|jgi:hypothetical protein|nr:hypothetical protein AOA80_10920 [Methanomassiliicoccales archaeon RumEn M1]
MTARSAPARKEEGRPRGVTVLTGLYVLSALLTILSGLLAFGLLSLLGPLGTAVGAAVGVALVAIGVVQLVIAWGLWRGRRWARILAIILTVLGLVPDVIGSLTLNPLSLVGLLIGLLILWYLYQPQVRAFYG